ncbi:MAG TPA: hypothetical protein QF753_05525 [Victivallales bacterium]|nr:hypothetical protein [Victivallales bacterium]
MKSLKLLFFSFLLLSLIIDSAFAVANEVPVSENKNTKTVPMNNLKKAASIIGNRKANTVSEKKIQKIEKIIYSYVDKGSNISRSEVKKEIINEVNDIYRMHSKDKPEIVNFVKINKSIDQLIAKQFPLSKKELKAKLEKIALKKFQPAKINSVMTLTYKQGPYKRTITGRYYGLTYYNDGVKIENTVIPIFDLSGKDKNKFDSKLREFKQKKFVIRKIDKYEERKVQFINKTRRDEIRLIVEKNEKMGFIFTWGKWRTPKAVTLIMIDYVISQIKAKYNENS